MSYKPRSILVTGGAGFIGSHFVEQIVRDYPSYKVVVLDRLDYCSNFASLEPLLASSTHLKFVKGDVTNFDLITHLLVSEEIETIVHFAAETHVDNSFGRSLEFTKSNILGTHVILEACRAHMPHLKRLVHISTDEVYGENKGSTFTEKTSTFDPTNPYAATKASAEMLVKAYQQSYAMPIIVCRGNNVYGPRQYPEKVIPKFIHLAMRDLPLCVHGQGKQLRSYLYVEDVANAYNVVLHKGETGQIYNIGTSSEITISQVAEDVCKAFHRNPATHIEHVADRLINDQRYYMDASKLESLGWKPKVGWEEGFTKTIEWYVKNPKHWSHIEGALKAHPTVEFDPSSDYRFGSSENDSRVVEYKTITVQSDGGWQWMAVAVAIGALFGVAVVRKA